MEIDDDDLFVQSAVAEMNTTNFQSWCRANVDDLARVSLVFTDIVGSTTLLYEVGDDVYDSLLTEHLDTARSLLADCDGREINSTGDGLFCAFRNTTEAFRFSCTFFKSPGPPQVQIRVGVHSGYVKMRRRDVCGRNVHFTSRVMSQAVGPQIWMSDTARSDLDPTLRARLKLAEYPKCILKNVPGEHSLWRLLNVSDVWF